MLRYLKVKLWGYEYTPCTLDRWLALILHKLSFMGKEEVAIYHSFIKPGMTVVDAGANQGIFALLAAKLVGEKGRVIAFEPEVKLAQSLRQNILMNKIENLRLEECGLGDKQTSGHLEIGTLNRGDNRLSENGTGLKVKICRLDEFIDVGAIDFLKIDVQGYELSVLKGLMPQLKTEGPQVIFFEFWPEGLKRVGDQPEELIGLLHECRYTVGVINEGEFLSLNRSEIMDRSQGTWTNFVATRVAKERN